MLAKKLLEAVGNATQATYIEDVFSTYLYTGNSSTQTITNGIDLAGKGGLVWTKSRSAAQQHTWADTARGIDNVIYSSLTNAQTNFPTSITAVSNTGYSLGSYTGDNSNAGSYASWTFRKQPKFFDVVTFTYGGSVQNISHSLGSIPGMIVLKQTANNTQNWMVYHRSIGSNTLELNTTSDQQANGQDIFGNGISLTTPTSTQFTVGAGLVSGNTYVAYLFAHNAGGFGLTGTDNVISCGSMVTATPLVNVNLGYEPQLVMWKRTDAAGNWGIADNMRGMPVSGDDQVLIPNLSNAEALATRIAPNATGFTFDGGVADGSTFIYIAIRRGPMKVPTDATKVFKPMTRTGNATVTSITGVGFSPDLTTFQQRDGANNGALWFDRLRGITRRLTVNSTGAEGAPAGSIVSYDMDGITVGDNSGGNTTNWDTFTYSNLFFKRAPGFFDEVCYTGTGSAALLISNNLSAVPEMAIIKCRSTASTAWFVYHKGATANGTLLLNSTNADIFANGANGITYPYNPPTSNDMAVYAGSSGVGNVNTSGATYVMYLFATCPGVSKVGSYTGTGTTQTINCGFTAGARFVLIKRTDSTGDWYTYDTARGIVSGNDPYLLLNSTSAEVTITDFIDPVSTGFALDSTALATINVSGGSYIFLAIA